ncbi:MAG: hypothetical protein SFU86_05590 [Pirellulaceae bacterium]|nr:hypothetical protein [Pirellulaceae bacterium]
MGLISIDVSHDGKAITVESDNLLDDIRKKVKHLIVLNPFQVYVEIPFDEDLGKNEDKVFDAVRSVVNNIKKDLDKVIEELTTRLEDLQIEEAAGKSVYDQAEKSMKTAEKKIKDLAGITGTDVRKAVQKTTGSGQLRSASRTVFRGIELAREAFDEHGAGEQPSVSRDTAKALSALGKEAFKLSQQEKDARTDLEDALNKQLAQIRATFKENQKAAEKEEKKAETDKSKDKDKKKPEPIKDPIVSEKDFDIKEYAKRHQAEVRAVEAARTKYVDLVKSFNDKLEAGKVEFTKFYRLLEKAKEPDKDVEEAFDKFGESLGTILDTMPDKLEAGEGCLRVFKDDFKGGASFEKALKELAACKGTTKSGKNLEAAGAVLEKLARQT